MAGSPEAESGLGAGGAPRLNAGAAKRGTKVVPGSQLNSVQTEFVANPIQFFATFT